MNAGFLQVGKQTYVNPRNITRIEPSYDFEESSWIHTTDGKYIETDQGYTPEKIINELNKLNYYV